MSAQSRDSPVWRLRHDAHDLFAAPSLRSEVDPLTTYGLLECVISVTACAPPQGCVSTTLNTTAVVGDWEAEGPTTLDRIHFRG